jgi:two-component system, NarL family, invasion response regulator UvrY
MNILICEDHTLFRDGIKKALIQLADVECIDEAGNDTEAMALLKVKKYEMVLMDISLPGKSGIELLELIKTKWPETRVLMLSMYPEELYGMRCLKLGASGYLNKDADSLKLVDAIKRVANGHQYISDNLATIMTLSLNKNSDKPPHEMLTDRAFGIMLELAAGISYVEIGKHFTISKDTVGTYRTRIMNKMGFKKNAELTQYCIQHKLIL